MEKKDERLRKEFSKNIYLFYYKKKNFKTF